MEPNKHSLIMGVVNLTPDSFSDGGQHLDPGAALDRIQEILEDGADLVDIGAESSRPGAEAIHPDVEWKRLEPVLNELDRRRILNKVSVDTRHEVTMRRLLKLPVGFVNNISGLSDPAMLPLLADRPNLKYICMHMHGAPQTMQDNPLRGAEAVRSVEEFFAATHAKLTAAGFTSERLFFDPGIGFGKDDAANFQLLSMIPEFTKTYQLVLGISRKSFIGRILKIDQPRERDPASKMLEFGIMLLGGHIIRTHQVGPLVKMRAYLL